MRIQYKLGDLTRASEQCLVHGANAMGVAGAGVALAIRRAFPEAYRDYRREYDIFGLKPGQVIYSYSRGKVVLHAITQLSFGTDRQHLDYEALLKTLTVINTIAPRDYGVDAIAMPRIGAGLGGGNWEIISAVIESTSTHYQPVVYDL